MCINVAENNLEKLFRTFLFMKLLYKNGKAQFTKVEVAAISQMMGYKDVRQVSSHIDKLLRLKWLRRNSVTGYYQICSFDKLRVENDWESRASVECCLKDLTNIRAFIGGVIYTYLHKSFWRRVKKEKSVQLKGSTYHFLFPSFNFKMSYAPIAITGVNKMFNISISKASYLKREAARCGYIKLKKNYSETVVSKADLKVLTKYDDFQKNIVFHKGKYCLQLIDSILPQMPIRKRKKLI